VTQQTPNWGGHADADADADADAGAVSLFLSHIKCRMDPFNQPLAGAGLIPPLSCPAPTYWLWPTGYVHTREVQWEIENKRCKREGEKQWQEAIEVVNHCKNMHRGVARNNIS